MPPVGLDEWCEPNTGETDPQVGRETFRAALGRDPSHEELGRLYATYLWRLSEDIWTSKGYRVLDGAEKLLDQLAEAAVTLGIVSGNTEGAARTKLAPGNLGRYFVFGSYGSDSADRAEVTRLAIAKASRLIGHDLAREEVFVVGDTPRDVEAAHAAGATAVGVASGQYDVAHLRDAKADHVLASLTQPFPGL